MIFRVGACGLVAAWALALTGCAHRDIGTPFESDESAGGNATRIHREAIVVDAHNDVGTWILDFGFDLGMDGGDARKRSAESYWVLDWLLSRPSDETFWDALEETTAPIMASHSSVRALVDSPRNLSDEMLEAIAANEGVIMINFAGITLDPRKSTTPKLVWDIVSHWRPSTVPLDRVLEHIEHVIDVAGVDHVGFGSDFDGTRSCRTDCATSRDFPGSPRGCWRGDIRNPMCEKFSVRTCFGSSKVRGSARYRSRIRNRS